jgi:hypothetical protein
MRSRVEATLRAAGLAALVVWILLGVRPRASRDATAGVAGLSDALARWTTADPVGAVHVRLDTAPDATHAAWLSALRVAGIAVGWQGDRRALSQSSRSFGPLPAEEWNRVNFEA